MQLSSIFVSLSVMLAVVSAAPAKKSRMNMGSKLNAKGVTGAAYCTLHVDTSANSY